MFIYQRVEEKNVSGKKKEWGMDWWSLLRFPIFLPDHNYQATRAGARQLSLGSPPQKKHGTLDVSATISS